MPGDKSNLKRPIHFHFRANTEEAEAIRGRMAEMGITSLGAYLRKMAINGYHITLDLSDVREMVVQLSRIGNNINQIAKRANEARSIHVSDVEALQHGHKEIWEAANKILTKLAAIK